MILFSHFFEKEKKRRNVVEEIQQTFPDLTDLLRGQKVFVERLYNLCLFMEMSILPNLDHQEHTCSWTSCSEGEHILWRNHWAPCKRALERIYYRICPSTG